MSGAAPIVRADPASLRERWTFVPSTPSWRIRLRRILATTRRRAAPAHQVQRPVAPAPRWNALFLFLPSGGLDSDQRRILARVRALTGRLLVVFAAPSPRPDAALEVADALIWKDLPGYDFSAYALALDAIARGSPGALAYLQNDSVLGPFGDMDALVGGAPWDLTGFIGSGAVENHLSSFAFVLRDVTPARVEALAPALSPAFRYDGFEDVVLMQETRLARVAARSMTVGAHLYTPDAPRRREAGERLRHLLPGAPPRAIDLSGDPALSHPALLLDRGLPFVKRSLFGKFAHVREAGLERRLAELGWGRGGEQG